MKMSKANRKLKITLRIIGVIVILALLGIVSLAMMARWAVSDYRGDTASQLNNIIAGETTGVPVELRGILFGKILGGDYERVEAMNGEYKTLLNDTKSYIAVRDAHDALVEQYNAGVNGKKPLGSDMLKSVNKYRAVIENHFPDEKDRAKTLGNLSTKITSNTDFDAVSSNIDAVLQSSDTFLAELREELNARITEFQKKVN
ncbi:MAG: hypothetical protein LBQ11_00555 [Candidatus Nomurabacteria bacterium]|jgi:hypothetical protein|nr:hypothetical protein [Candidatus Nomurabacteria bacterium]